MIRTPSINLARRPFRNNSLYYGAFSACTALLLVATGYNVHGVVRTGRDIARLEQQQEERARIYMQLRDEVEGMKKGVEGIDLKTLDTKSSFANGLILSRLFSWSRLFDRIEGLIPPNVKIRSIRPAISPSGIELQIDGLAKTPEDLYAFEEALVGSDYFSGVYPLGENSKESRGEINFDLAMHYVPAGKSQAIMAATAVPASPTEGLPQPAAGESEAEAEDPAKGADQAAEAESRPAEGAPASADESPSAADAAALPAPEASAPAPQAPAAEAPVAEGPAAPGGAPPPPAVKKPVEMTNKEFLDRFGRDLLLKRRGGMKPTAPSKNAQLTNQEYIEKFGVDEFLKARGDLTIARQTRSAPPGPPGGNP